MFLTSGRRLRVRLTNARCKRGANSIFFKHRTIECRQECRKAVQNVRQMKTRGGQLQATDVRHPRLVARALVLDLASLRITHSIRGPWSLSRYPSPVANSSCCEEESTKTPVPVAEIDLTVVGDRRILSASPSCNGKAQQRTAMWPVLIPSGYMCKPRHRVQDLQLHYYASNL